jgi:phosphoadenosine phosphosulfate reductase
MAVSTFPIDFNTTEEELRAISDEFEDQEPEAVLGWALEEFGSEIAVATGFGAEGCVLVSIVAAVDRNARFFYLDTDLLFAETYALRDRLEARYGIRFERRRAELSLSEQAAAHGERLWERAPDECCRLRKVEPLKQMLAGLRAWVTGIRQDQSPARASARVIERDPRFGVIKINPLVRWSKKKVWDYIVRNEVPYNPLHDRGYPSIGCVPCTTPVQIGEDPRAGRWRGSKKIECGIHEKGRG